MSHMDGRATLEPQTTKVLALLSPMGLGRRRHGAEDALCCLAQTSRVSCCSHCISISILGRDPGGGQKYKVPFLYALTLRDSLHFLPSPLWSLESAACLELHL